MVALLTLFDQDGDKQISRSEWELGSSALSMRASDDDWANVLNQFGGVDRDTLDFTEVVSMFGSRRPCEGYLEEILRR